MKFVNSNPLFCINKLNMLTNAVFQGKYKAMSLLKDKFELQTVHEGKTLIEICADAGDITTFDMCMQLLVDSKEPYINQETLGLIISSQE